MDLRTSIIRKVIKRLETGGCFWMVGFERTALILWASKRQSCTPFLTKMWQ